MGGEFPFGGEAPGAVEGDGGIEIAAAKEAVGVAGREFDPEAGGGPVEVLANAGGDVADAVGGGVVATGEVDLGESVGGDVARRVAIVDEDAVPPVDDGVEDSAAAVDVRDFDEPLGMIREGLAMEEGDAPGFAVFVDSAEVAHFVGDGELPAGFGGLGDRSEGDGAEKDEGDGAMVADGEDVVGTSKWRHESNQCDETSYEHVEIIPSCKYA